MRQIYMTLCGLLFSLSAFPQESKFQLEFGTGAAYGQWTVVLGKEYTVNMVDKSPMSFTLPVFLIAGYTFGKLEAAIKVKNSILFVDEIRGWGHADDTYAIDQLSRNGRVNLLQLMIGAGYPMVQRAGYQLVPHIYVGTFWENSVHPEKEDFGFRSAWEFGVSNRWTLKNVDLAITPFYSRLRTRGRTLTIASEPGRTTHKIHQFGIEGSVRFGF